jgi:hypothetical protein
LLATTAASALSRFKIDGSPYVRLDGITLTTDLVDFSVPLNLTSAGQYTNDVVATGAQNLGSVSGVGQNCANWMDHTAGNNVVTGFSAYVTPRAVGARTDSMCSEQDLHVYCLETP